MSDREGLVAAFLDGEATPEERDALVGALQADPAFARDVAGLLVTERLLRLHRSDADAFVREVRERLRPGGPSLERRIVGRVRSRWLPWAAAAAAVLVAIGVWVFQPGGAASLELPVLAGAHGKVVVIRGTGPHEAKVGASVEPGDRIETDSISGVEVRYRRGSTVLLGPNSAASIHVSRFDDDQAFSVHLGKGTLAATLAPQKTPASFSTPHGQAIVRGTRFDLNVGRNSTRLEVQEGRIHLCRTGETHFVQVAANQFAVAGPGMELAARPIRVGKGIVALYRMREAEGGRVRDVSGLEPALDFTMKDAAGKPMAEPWKIGRGATVGFVVPPARLVEAVRKSRGITIEMWLRREGAAGVTHVVRTFGTSGVVRVYADGAPKAEQRLALDLATWDGEFRTLLADDVSRQWPWPGEYDLIAIYDRALAEEEVARNFQSGRSQ